MAESYGWAGKILRVNLTTGEITTQDDEKYHKYIGGMGMAYRIMYEEAPMELDPYDEKALVIFGVGPLTGAGVPCSGRMNVTFRSTWSKGSSIIDAHMGGHIGPMLKYAGWDGIVITGISAYDRSHTVRTAVRPDAKPTDLSQPGHIFPLIAQPGGVLTRAGHTEAASDLPLLAGLEPAGVLVEVLNPDGTMARRPQLEVFAREHGLKMGSIADLIAYRLATEHTVERIDEREIDTEFGPFRLVTYRDRIAHELHFALVRGTPDRTTPTLVRVQVENALSDLLHWRRDDFGVHATDALRAIAAALVETGVTRILVAGGETSVACVQALGITQMRMGARMAPGVPWCHAVAPDAKDGLHITLKSGNFGGTDFFTKAFAQLQA